MYLGTVLTREKEEGAGTDYERGRIPAMTASGQWAKRRDCQALREPTGTVTATGAGGAFSKPNPHGEAHVGPVANAGAVLPMGTSAAAAMGFAMAARIAGIYGEQQRRRVRCRNPQGQYER